jgi:hypothetical protein
LWDKRQKIHGPVSKWTGHISHLAMVEKLSYPEKLKGPTFRNPRSEICNRQYLLDFPSAPRVLSLPRRAGQVLLTGPLLKETPSSAAEARFIPKLSRGRGTVGVEADGPSLRRLIRVV